MRFTVDTTSAIPIYAQLITGVKHAIAAGVLRAGDALPSLRELAGELRVNPLTVARAYRELEAMGIITTGHGRGSFISDGAADLGETYRREALAEVIDRLLVEAYHLGATPEEIRSLIEERLHVMQSGKEEPIGPRD
ncbi:MAG: GntR family transcriptional regulator [Armatimonadota bacterium]